MYDRRFITVTSNSVLYPNQYSNDFRVKLPEPLQFEGDNLCALHSISYPHSWRKLGLKGDPFMDVVFDTRRGHNVNVRLVFEPYGFTTCEELVEYVNTEIRAVIERFAFDEVNVQFFRPYLKKGHKEKVFPTTTTTSTTVAPENTTTEKSTDITHDDDVIENTTARAPPPLNTVVRAKRSKSMSDIDETVEPKRIRRADPPVQDKDKDKAVLGESDILDYIETSDNVEDLRKKANELQQSLRDVDIRREIAENRASVLERDVLQLQTTVQRLTTTNGTLTTEKEAFKQKSENLEKTKTSVETQKTQLESTVSNLQKELKDAKQKVDDSKATDADLKEAKNKVAELEGRLALLQADLDTTKSVLEETVKDLNEANDKNATLSATITSNQEQIAHYDREVSRLMDEANIPLQQMTAERDRLLRQLHEAMEQIYKFTDAPPVDTTPKPVEVDEEQLIFSDLPTVFTIDPVKIVSNYSVEPFNTNILSEYDPFHWKDHYRGSVHVKRNVKREAGFQKPTIKAEVNAEGKPLLEGKRRITIKRRVRVIGGKMFEDADYDVHDKEQRADLLNLAEDLVTSNLDGFKLEKNGHITVNFGKQIEYVILSPELNYVMGFGERFHLRSQDHSKHSVDLNAGLHGFVIYEQNGLLEPYTFSDKLETALRYVTVRGKWGDVIEENYTNPTWVKVQARHIDELHFQIKTLTNDLMPFDWGTIIMTLVFRRALGA